jgi:hypothetical protein
MHTVPLVTIDANGTVALLALDVLVGIIMLYAAARLLHAPRSWFARGRLSKALWLFLSFWLTWRVGNIVLPVGAVVSLRHLRGLSRRHLVEQPPDLPFAAGTRVTQCDQP